MQLEAARMLYSVAEGDRGEALVYSNMIDDVLSPVELSAWLLQHLVQQAERELGEPVTGAVSLLRYHKFWNFFFNSLSI